MIDGVRARPSTVRRQPHVGRSRRQAKEPNTDARYLMMWLGVAASVVLILGTYFVLQPFRLRTERSDSVADLTGDIGSAVLSAQDQIIDYTGQIDELLEEQARDPEIRALEEDLFKPLPGEYRSPSDSPSDPHE